MQTCTTEAIRNIVLISHSGAGKTSLAEALLFNTKATTRLGKIEDGTTTSDYEPEEIKRASSVQNAIVPCEWGKAKLNIIDTPGYADFLGEVVAALQVADAAVLLVDATAGVQVGTEQAWKYLEDKGLPRLILINKLDRENADFFRTLEGIQKRFGRRCAPIQVPVGAPGAFKGVVNLLQPGEGEQVAQYRDKLVEAVAETDDDLTAKYLDAGELSQEELIQGLKEGIKSQKIVPVAGGSAAQNLGIDQLMDILVQFFPSPKEALLVQASKPNAGDRESIVPDAEAPLLAQVFKTTADPYVGRLSYFRVYRGTLRSNSQVWNSTKGVSERIGQLSVPRGKVLESIPHLVAGDIGAVAKLGETSTGDTLCVKEHSLILPPIPLLEPTYDVAVSPKTKADLDKMGSSLTRLCEEDPSLRIKKDPSTGEIILAGRGDSHMEVAAEKLKRKFGVEIILGVPNVPYRETIVTSTKAEYKHKKQSGGHGQYGHVFLELQPLPRGSGVQFAARVVGGTVPKNYIPAVEKGVMSAVQEGVLAHYPIADVKVTLYDGSYHAVDSSDMAFQIAGFQAVKKGVAQAQPILLEPIVKMQVVVPDNFTGDVIGDLNSKRARVLGMVPDNGMTTIDAEAPLAEVLRYSTTVRSLTQGRGSYTMTFSHYEEVPAHITQRIVQEASATKS